MQKPAIKKEARLAKIICLAVLINPHNAKGRAAARPDCREVIVVLLGLLGSELRDRAASDEEVGDHGDD